MAVESNMLALGTPAPDFSLPNTNTAGGGQTVDLGSFAGESALLVAFICNHCPYVVRIREGLVDFAREYGTRGLATVAISSNDVENYPDDRPERMTEDAGRYGYSFPYLYDETQAVAKDYGAACTPDFFLFDAERRLVYRGQFDGARPRNDVPVTGADLRAAADAVLSGQAVPGEQRASIGCGIKWKPGNEPA